MLFYFVLNICIMTCTIINNSRYIQLTVVIYSVEDIHTFESRELSLSDFNAVLTTVAITFRCNFSTFDTHIRYEQFVQR